MGISYAVVTKVKELTEARQYGEALDLLEGEDIFQSLNPQFLRICGEIYLENNRFYESREALVRAHIMAPEGNRIIYDLVCLYLKMGYFQRAKKYYDIYVHNAVPDDVGALHLQYMIRKAQRADAEVLLQILERICEEQYSDEWGFELALLYASLGMKGKMKEECVHLMAAFRNSPYYALAESLKKEEYDISNSYFRFPIMETEEDKEAYRDILNLEEKQLEKDEQKVHPPDPVILQMEDDDGTEESEQKEKGAGIRLPFSKKHERTGRKRGQDISGEVSEMQASSAPDAPGPAEESEMSGAVSPQAATEEALEQPAAEGSGMLESAEDISRTTATDIAISTDETVSTAAPPSAHPHPSAESSEVASGEVSAYIESVMKSVADIETSVAEELQHPISFTGGSDSVKKTGEKNTEAEGLEKNYQPKLLNVEENLSPKERLEQLMKMIEEEREAENQKSGKEHPQEEEELDMDEFLMNLVGASTITEAMVKSYREEQDAQKV